MLKISGFYLYSIRSYSAFKMGENGSRIKLRVHLCWSAGQILSDFDNWAEILHVLIKYILLSHVQKIRQIWGGQVRDRDFLKMRWFHTDWPVSNWAATLLSAAELTCHWTQWLATHVWRITSATHR